MTRRETLIAYLLSSVEAEDWHAVRDAAVDIEVLDAASRAVTPARPTAQEPMTAAVYYNRIDGHGPSCPCDECAWYRSNEILKASSPAPSFVGQQITHDSSCECYSCQQSRTNRRVRP